MGLQIGPDLGDSIDIQDLGVRWTVTYSFIDDTTDPDTGLPLFNNGEKDTFTAEFPRDFNEINPDDVEGAMLQLATMVARNTNVHS